MRHTHRSDKGCVIVPPISVVFAITGLAAWANGLYFLGIGTKQEEGGA